MTLPLSAAATDWTGQTIGQRLRLCAETLYVHGQIDRQIYDDLTDHLELRSHYERSGSGGAGPPVHYLSSAGAPSRGAGLDCLGLLAAGFAAGVMLWILWGFI